MTGTGKNSAGCLFAALAILFFFLSFSPLRAQSSSFPANHWVYEFLNRLQAKHKLHYFLPGTKPYTRLQIARALAPVMKSATMQTGLNEVELAQLKYLKFEFREELSRLGVDTADAKDQRLTYLRHKTFLRKLLPGFILQNGRNHFSLDNGSLTLNGDFILDYKTDREKSSYQADRTVIRERRGIFLWGNWGDNVQYYFDFRDGTERGGRYPAIDKNWSFERMGFVSAQGGKVSFDETNSGLFLGHSFYQIMIGKEKNRWGPGRFGALALSDWATSYDQIKLYLHWEKIRFTAVTGFLRSYPPLIGLQYDTGNYLRQVRTNKYLAAHRLEFAPVPSLIFGLHETLIYGERNLEPAYLNPINFYWSAEHYLGDQDNSALGVDFTWFPGWNLKLYGELFLDDLQTGKLGTDWYGNKWALLTGFSMIDVAGLSNLDLHVEWSKVRPYVYTHRFPVNVYKHFTTPLGYRAGPNTETFSLELDYRRSKNLLFRAGFNDYRHGANPPDRNVGGNLDQPHRISDPTNQKALAGELEKRQTGWFSFSYELFRNTYFSMAYYYNRDHHFPNDTGNRTDGSGSELLVRFSVNR